MSITLTIILCTGVLSFVAFNREELREDMLFWPYMAAARGQHYRFITGGMVHADFMHLFFNMVSLYSFGSILEEVLMPVLFDGRGRGLFALLYGLSLVFSCLPDFFLHRHNPGYRALGASGAVSAVIYSAITIVPTMPIRFLFIPFDIPGWVFGFLYLALSYQLARRGGGNIGHNAHFWGAVFGIVYTLAAARAFAGIDLAGRFLAQVLPG
jgi:membrane associated rhomboid family serine protease